MNKEELNSELSVFFSEIQENLPKSIERKALGDNKIFIAVKIAYTKFRPVLIKKIQEETLREVLPEEDKSYQESIEAGVCFSARGHNQCRQEIINKAKDKWNIEL